MLKVSYLKEHQKLLLLRLHSTEISNTIRRNLQGGMGWLLAYATLRDTGGI